MEEKLRKLKNFTNTLPKIGTLEYYEKLQELSQYDQNIACICDIRYGATEDDISLLKVNKNGKFNANDTNTDKIEAKIEKIKFGMIK
jgi:hypothetical protein